MVDVLLREGSLTVAGTVIVLTTPDANRTFLSYLGTSQDLELTPEVTAAVRGSRMVALEGYLWEMPGAAAGIQQVHALLMHLPLLTPWSNP